jgi:hypothetical protein
MPSFHNLLQETKVRGSVFDILRREWLEKLASHTGRNVIIYYSGWLQKPGMPGLQVNDADKNGFMSVIHGLDRSKGLDLVLHTPGGETAATESIVDYLHSMFGTNIRAIVPQLAMSAGTMIACAAREIVMGKQSSLGPVDPQFGGIAAHGIVEEFKRAYEEIKADPAKIPVWQPIIAKYHPTFVGECEKAIDWASEMVREWLARGMFSGEADAQKKIDTILNELADHALTKTVLSLHHACILTLGGTPAFKMIENQNAVAFIQVAQTMLMAGGGGTQMPGQADDAAPASPPAGPSPSPVEEPSRARKAKARMRRRPTRR